jgi:hypothetical protein
MSTLVHYPAQGPTPLAAPGAIVAWHLPQYGRTAGSVPWNAHTMKFTLSAYNMVARDAESVRAIPTGEAQIMALHQTRRKLESDSVPPAPILL